MDNNQIVNIDLLQQTFAQLESQKGGTTGTEAEKLEGIFALLGGKFEKPFILKQMKIIDALYRVLPDRNIDMLEDRVHILFENQLNNEAKQILSWVIFGTENALEEGNEDDLITRQIRLNHGLSGEGAMGDEIEGATGRFGFDKTNPIPINGIDNINNYLDKLRLVTGESITYKRLHAVNTEALPFQLDLYEIYNLAEKAIARLFVYAYHGENSGKAPEGFELLA